MKCLNIYIVVIGKTWTIFMLKMEMETRQDKNDEKQKENEKDEKKTYKENDRFDNHYLNR